MKSACAACAPEFSNEMTPMLGSEACNGSHAMSAAMLAMTVRSFMCVSGIQCRR
jgi:hypothetical protein